MRAWIHILDVPGCYECEVGAERKSTLQGSYIPGTIHYLSDGLETLHYYARENPTIIVTAESVPENV